MSELVEDIETNTLALWRIGKRSLMEEEQPICPNLLPRLLLRSATMQIHFPDNHRLFAWARPWLQSEADDHQQFIYLLFICIYSGSWFCFPPALFCEHLCLRNKPTEPPLGPLEKEQQLLKLGCNFPAVNAVKGSW